jgi:hypothetical protein
MSAAEVSTRELIPWSEFITDFFEAKPSVVWPNSKTFCAVLSTITNMACEALKYSFSITLRCNIPVRVFSIIYHRDDFYKVVRELVSLAALVAFAALSILMPLVELSVLLTCGRYVAICFDIVPEVVQFFHYLDRQNKKDISGSIPNGLPNPKVLEGAKALLNLSDQEMMVPTTIREHYFALMDYFKEKLNKNPPPDARSSLIKLISCGQEAYRTLGGEPKDSDWTIVV